jgi:hypothetical protein
VGHKPLDPAIELGQCVGLSTSHQAAFLTDIRRPLIIPPDALIGAPASPILSPFSIFCAVREMRIKVGPIRRGMVISATREGGLTIKMTNIV